LPASWGWPLSRERQIWVVLTDAQGFTHTAGRLAIRSTEIKRIFQSPREKEQRLLSNYCSRFGFDVLKRDQHQITK
jgi:hypothetical protein